eukprot:Gregarina_sp_Pseudo_9__3966@NODE_410_length_2896_cov_13_895695_g387_i0_p5_GENE_NODE_410_length_2896_cov_13_895695_g387_i0NODE_410_length_2896_cov_13_895695_g387_i0_p5_ORF_typecomplete_len102_score5_21_NODE_410_length_2896_cov_13_895695_g387_i017472052
MQKRSLSLAKKRLRGLGSRKISGNFQVWAFLQLLSKIGVKAEKTNESKGYIDEGCGKGIIKVGLHCIFLVQSPFLIGRRNDFRQTVRHHSPNKVWVFLGKE